MKITKEPIEGNELFDEKNTVKDVNKYLGTIYTPKLGNKYYAISRCKKEFLGTFEECLRFILSLSGKEFEIIPIRYKHKPTR